MTFPGTLSNIKISHNSLDISILSGGTYTYSALMLLGGSAVVNDNSFSGCVGGSTISTDLISVTSGSSIFTGNSFIRGAGSPVNSYINIITSNDQNITDNIFDQVTTDGSNETLVLNLSDSSVYERNKNQTKYIPITMLNGVTPSLVSTSINRYGDVSSGSEITYVTSTSGVPGGIQWFTQAGGGGLGAVNRRITFRADLNSYLPENIKLLSGKIGFFTVDAGTVTLAANNTFVITVSTHDMVTANYTVGTNSLLDQRQLIVGTGLPAPTVVSTTFDINANYTASKSTTQYINLDFIANPLNIRNTSIDFQADLSINITSITAFGLMQFYISPFILKCRW